MSTTPGARHSASDPAKTFTEAQFQIAHAAGIRACNWPALTQEVSLDILQNYLPAAAAHLAALAPPAAVPDEVRRLSEAATQGEWVAGDGANNGSAEHVYAHEPVAMPLAVATFGLAHPRLESRTCSANAHFAAAAVNYVRALIATAPPSGRAGDEGEPKSDGGQRIIDGLNDAIAFARGDTSRGRLLRVEDGRVVDATPPASAGAVDGRDPWAALRRIADLRFSEAGEPFDDALDIADTALAAAPEPAAVGQREIVRHIKSGGVYEVLFRGAQVQTNTPLSDYATVAAYRHVETGATWVRPMSEMDDGRFETVADPRTTSATGPQPAGGDGWRTIETAPRDGTLFLAFETGRGCARNPFVCWREKSPSSGAEYWQDDADSEPAPTHWHPMLPKPTPAVAGAEGGQR